MSISDSNSRKIMQAVTDQALGNLVVDAVAVAQMASHVVAQVIVATNVSTTVDFAGKLLVGDRVIMIPAVAGNSIHYLVATAGTLPAAAIVNNLYVVLRAVEAKSAVKL